MVICTNSITVKPYS